MYFHAPCGTFVFYVVTVKWAYEKKLLHIWFLPVELLSLLEFLRKWLFDIASTIALETESFA